MNLLIDGRTALFAGLVDYAGLFPPASLDLAGAAAEYRTAREGPHSWMLGRFLCPTSHLEDLAGLLTTTMPVGEQPWSIGAIVDEPPGVGALHAQVFDRHMSPAARIDAIELRLPEEATLADSVGAASDVIRPLAEAVITVSPEVVPYLEVARPPEPGYSSFATPVGAIAHLRTKLLRKLGAKLRTGGTTADAFPEPLEVARFILACRTAGLEYKATAGLHHPVRHHDADIGVTRHGFLNLLAASALAVSGASEGDLIEVLEETDAAAFVVGASGMRVGQRRIAVPVLRTMRSELFPAYGSCSFDEPVDELTTMGLLE